MNACKLLIPVIDIKDGRVVSGRLGKTDEYEELQSVVCDSSDPLVVAKTYEELGFSEVYIADIDGITESKPNTDAINRIIDNTNLSAMVDLGIWSPDLIVLMSRVKPVIATETFCSLNLLEFPGDIVLCIDTVGGELLSETCGNLSDFISIIKDTQRIKEVILIDLERLEFAERGPNFELCESVVPKLPGKKVIYGGGIRGLYDIYALKKSGIDSVLLGAALYSGIIFRDAETGCL